MVKKKISYIEYFYVVNCDVYFVKMTFVSAQRITFHAGYMCILGNNDLEK